jgi:hypothetical protein
VQKIAVNSSTLILELGGANSLDQPYIEVSGNIEAIYYTLNLPRRFDF